LIRPTLKVSKGSTAVGSRKRAKGQLVSDWYSSNSERSSSIGPTVPFDVSGSREIVPIELPTYGRRPGSRPCRHLGRAGRLCPVRRRLVHSGPRQPSRTCLLLKQFKQWAQLQHRSDLAVRQQRRRLYLSGSTSQLQIVTGCSAAPRSSRWPRGPVSPLSHVSLPKGSAPKRKKNFVVGTYSVMERLFCSAKGKLLAEKQISNERQTPMSHISEYQNYATQCLKLAKDASNEGDRRSLVQMAGDWQALVDRVLRRDPQPQEPKPAPVASRPKSREPVEPALRSKRPRKRPPISVRTVLLKSRERH
jgi:hypothetical protein